MTTANISFDLPDERTDLLCAIHGVRLYGALHDIDEYLRQLLKHDGIKTMRSQRLAEEIRAMIADDMALVEE